MRKFFVTLGCAVLAGLMICAQPVDQAAAQWQVGQYCSPIGKGGGVTGFGAACPTAAGGAFISTGTTSNPAFTLTPTWTGLHTYAGVPSYSLASGVLAAAILMPLDAASHTVGASKQYNHIRISQPSGGYNQFTLGAGAIGTGVSVFTESLSGSASDSNNYAVAGSSQNSGAGIVKAGHFAVVGNGSSTGVNVAVSAGIIPVATSDTNSTAIEAVLNNAVDDVVSALRIESPAGGRLNFGVGSTIGAVPINWAFYDAWMGSGSASGANAFQLRNSAAYVIAKIDKVGAITSGLAGTQAGQINIAGGTSGTAAIVAQAAAGTPTLTLPTLSGTFVTTAGTGLSISATTGQITASAITLNAGSGSGLSAPGAMSLGSTYTVGATTDTVRFASLGLGRAAPASGILDVDTGIRVGGAATSGNVLRGNGTNFVSAALAAADLSNGVTGSGSVVLATAPTLGTSVTVPRIIGGFGTTGTQLTVQTTSGNGTTDAIAFVGGNNGGTTFGTMKAQLMTLNGGGDPGVGSNYGVMSLGGSLGSIATFYAGASEIARMQGTSSGAFFLSGAGVDFYIGTTAGGNMLTAYNSGGVSIGTVAGGANLGSGSMHVQGALGVGVSANIPTNGIRAAGAVQTGAVAVGSLPTCNAAAKGARHFVTDANATTFASTVAAGGANNVPVVCNGTNWIIG